MTPKNLEAITKVFIDYANSTKPVGHMPDHCRAEVEELRAAMRKVKLAERRLEFAVLKAEYGQVRVSVRGRDCDGYAWIDPPRPVETYDAILALVEEIAMGADGPVWWEYEHTT